MNTNNKNFKYSLKSIGLFNVFIVIYTIFILYLAYKLNIWEDEAYTLYTTSNSLFNVIKLSYLFEGQPPFYFILLWLWRCLNTSIFFARLLSVLFIIISGVYIFNYLSLKKFNSKWIIVLFLLNPFTIWAALEIRTYSFVILLSIVILYYFEKTRNSKSLYNKIFYIIFGIVAVYTQYYFVFYLFSLSLIILFLDGWKKYLSFCCLNLPIAVLFIPNFFYIYDQFVMHQDMQLKNISLYDKLSLVTLTPQQFLLSIVSIDLGRIGRWLIRIVFVFICLVTIFKLYKSKFQSKTCALIELFIPILTIYFIFAFIFLSTNMIYSDKYASIVFPLYIILFSLFSALGSVRMNLIFSCISMFYIFINYTTYKEPFIKRDNNIAAISYIKNNELKNEPIICFDKHTYLEMRNYYTGVNNLSSAKELIFDYNFYKNQMTDTIEFASSIKSKTVNSKMLWIITGTDVEFVNKKYINNQMLDRFINNNFTISIDTIFSGRYNVDFIRIRKLIKKENF